MKLADKIKQHGFIVLEVCRANGEEQIIFVRNITTGVGLQRMASHWATSSPGKELITHLAIGDDDTVTPTENVLTLTNQIYIEALDSINAFGVTLFGELTFHGIDIGVGSYSIKELGLYDAVLAGNLIAYHVLADGNQISSFSGADSCKVIWGLVNKNE